mmetsp:Transcript_39026/g.44473  ORF Transcript_39026/g.44473 Transcript_39026/m.44473 type:complete len:189 (+) Transcript_39026:494-1060(+)
MTESNPSYDAIIPKADDVPLIDANDVSWERADYQQSLQQESGLADFADETGEDQKEKIMVSVIQSLADFSIQELTVHYLSHSRVPLQSKFQKFGDDISKCIQELHEKWSDNTSVEAMLATSERIRLIIEQNFPRPIVCQIEQSLLNLNIALIERHVDKKLDEFGLVKAKTIPINSEPNMGTLGNWDKN